MPWLKHVILDLVCTAVIAIAVFAAPVWARWFVVIYTPFMLVMKLFSLIVGRGTIGRTMASKTGATGVPRAFFHILYGANVVLLAWGRWWIMAAAWLAIWGVSVAYERRVGPAL